MTECCLGNCGVCFDIHAIIGTDTFTRTRQYADSAGLGCISDGEVYIKYSKDFLRPLASCVFHNSSDGKLSVVFGNLIYTVFELSSFAVYLS